MEQQTHFKLQVFGSMKPDVFAGFVDCLGVVGGFDLFPFLNIEEMLRQTDQSFLDFYDITVTVWSPPSDVSVDRLIMCTIDSGHLEALYGGKEGSKEAVLV